MALDVGDLVSPDRDLNQNAARRIAILGGAESAVLDEVPSETGRFVQMFFVLLGTATVSAVSMVFALSMGLRLSLLAAIPVALVWGALIFTFDRFLTSTMKATQSRRLLIGLAIPRAILAVVIGIVVAEPLVLQIFQPDIDQELTTINLVHSREDQARLARGPEKQNLDSAKARVLQLQTQAQTGTIAGASDTSAAATAAAANVASINDQLKAEASKVAQARALYECELHGTGAGKVPGCSGFAGSGPSTDSAKVAYQQEQATYNALVKQLQQAQNVLAQARNANQRQVSASQTLNRAAARTALPAAQKNLVEAQQIYDARAAQVSGGNANATGLLNRMDALSALADKNPALNAAHFFVAALFLSIEILPVLSKLLISLGGPQLYDRVEEKVKTSKLKAVEADLGDEDWRFQQRLWMQRRVEQDMLAREEELGNKSNQYVANQMTKILDVALANWQREVDSQLSAADRDPTPKAERPVDAASASPTS